MVQLVFAVKKLVDRSIVALVHSKGRYLECLKLKKQMTEKVYQHTALFFEKNFSRDRMPNYKDHIDAESKTIDEKPEVCCHFIYLI